MKIIVGLGNPGAKYAGTRHNVGFDVIDSLAADPSCGRPREKFQSLVAEVKLGGEAVLLVKPQTFMNLSGRAAREVMDFYKLTPADFLIVCDDFNLPLGKLRARAAGSHGGQNGLRSVQECLGTDAYPRMRIGVGQPAAGEAIDFVLTRFKPGERAAAEEAAARAAQAAAVWVTDGIAACMNRFNSSEQEREARDEDRAKAKAERDKKFKAKDEAEGKTGKSE